MLAVNLIYHYYMCTLKRCFRAVSTAYSAANMAKGHATGMMDDGTTVFTHHLQRRMGQYKCIRIKL